MRSGKPVVWLVWSVGLRLDGLWGDDGQRQLTGCRNVAIHQLFYFIRALENNFGSLWLTSSGWVVSDYPAQICVVCTTDSGISTDGPLRVGRRQCGVRLALSLAKSVLDFRTPILIPNREPCELGSGYNTAS